MSEKLTPYLGSVLTNYENGCQMDLRLKLATDFLRARTIPLGTPPEEAARVALDLSTELLRLGEERGLLHPLPDNDEIDSGLRRHIRRNKRAEVFMNLITQKLLQDEAPPDLLRAMTLPPGTPPPGGNNA